MKTDKGTAVKIAANSNRRSPFAKNRRIDDVPSGKRTRAAEISPAGVRIAITESSRRCSENWTGSSTRRALWKMNETQPWAAFHATTGEKIVSANAAPT